MDRTSPTQRPPSFFARALDVLGKFYGVTPPAYYIIGADGTINEITDERPSSKDVQ